MASLFGNTVARYSSDSQRSFTDVPSSPSLSRSTWPANRLPNLVIMIELLRVGLGHKSGTTGHEVNGDRPWPSRGPTIWSTIAGRRRHETTRRRRRRRSRMMTTQAIEPRLELEQNLHMYRQMAKIRAFEEQANE